MSLSQNDRLTRAYAVRRMVWGEGKFVWLQKTPEVLQEKLNEIQKEALKKAGLSEEQINGVNEEVRKGAEALMQQAGQESTEKAANTPRPAATTTTAAEPTEQAGQEVHPDASHVSEAAVIGAAAVGGIPVAASVAGLLTTPGFLALSTGQQIAVLGVFGLPMALGTWLGKYLGTKYGHPVEGTVVGGMAGVATGHVLLQNASYLTTLNQWLVDLPAFAFALPAVGSLAGGFLDKKNPARGRMIGAGLTMAPAVQKLLSGIVLPNAGALAGWAQLLPGAGIGAVGGAMLSSMLGLDKSKYANQAVMAAGGALTGAGLTPLVGFAGVMSALPYLPSMAAGMALGQMIPGSEQVKRIGGIVGGVFGAFPAHFLLNAGVGLPLSIINPLLIGAVTGAGIAKFLAPKSAYAPWVGGGVGAATAGALTYASTSAIPYAALALPTLPLGMAALAGAGVASLAAYPLGKLHRWAWNTPENYKAPVLGGTGYTLAAGLASPLTLPIRLINYLHEIGWNVPVATTALGALGRTLISPVTVPLGLTLRALGLAARGTGAAARGLWNGTGIGAAATGLFRGFNPNYEPAYKESWMLPRAVEAVASAPGRLFNGLISRPLYSVFGDVDTKNQNVLTTITGFPRHVLGRIFSTGDAAK